MVQECLIVNEGNPPVNNPQLVPEVHVGPHEENRVGASLPQPSGAGGGLHNVDQYHRRLPRRYGLE